MTLHILIDQLNNGNLEFLSSMKIGETLTSAQMAACAAVLATGVLLALLGRKWIRFWSALLCLCAGMAAGAAAGSLAGLDAVISLLAGAAAGIVLAILCARFFRVGVFFGVFILGSLSCVCLLNPGTVEMLGICGGIGLALALVSLKFPVGLAIAVTVVAGVAMAQSAFSLLLPGAGRTVMIIFCAVLGAAGAVVQILLESRKRKKESLKKAAEIRETHSTANEVEKARAMMENLDRVPDEDEEDTE